MGKAWLGVVVLVLVCVPAWASEWTQIAHSDDAISYVDRSSAQYAGSRVTFWSKQAYSTTRQVRVGSELKPYTSLIMQTTIDCANRTQLNLAGRFYDSSGNLVTESSGNPAPRPIVPDSGADWERRALCR
jgi:hypothetical protein